MLPGGLAFLSISADVSWRKRTGLRMSPHRSGFHEHEVSGIYGTIIHRKGNTNGSCCVAIVREVHLPLIYSDMLNDCSFGGKKGGVT